jgi:chemotaxis protein methyltransferase CheR
LIDQLAGGGYLFVGHAESLSGMTSRVRHVMPTVYRLSENIPRDPAIAGTEL